MFIMMQDVGRETEEDGCKCGQGVKNLCVLRLKTECANDDKRIKHE